MREKEREKERNKERERERETHFFIHLPLPHTICLQLIHTRLKKNKEGVRGDRLILTRDKFHALFNRGCHIKRCITMIIPALRNR
jgi:hypothetical protein